MKLHSRNKKQTGRSKVIGFLKKQGVHIDHRITNTQIVKYLDQLGFEVSDCMKTEKRASNFIKWFGENLKTTPGSWSSREFLKSLKKKDLSDFDFYESWQWKKLRFDTLKKFGAVCMLCASRNDIVVDHIKPRSRFPELELDPDNMQVLCDSCNRGKSNNDYTDFRPKPATVTQLKAVDK